MNGILRNILAVVLGIFVGSSVNMGIIMYGPALIPPPDGVDLADMESLRNGMHLFQAQHFIMPFLAHALGTLIGAVLAALIAGSRKMWMAISVAVFFLFGGITNVVMLPAPNWFVAVDLVVAYLPMGWLGWRLAGGK